MGSQDIRGPRSGQRQATVCNVSEMAPQKSKLMCRKADDDVSEGC